jgi:hypothetical protein
MKLEFSPGFRKKKYSNTEFNENPSSGNRVVPCGRTDITKLIVAFPNYVIALKTWSDEKLYYEHPDHLRGSGVSISTITLCQ